jgi:hypothetical protein
MVIKVENKRGEEKRSVVAVIVEPKRVGFAQTPVRKDDNTGTTVAVGSTVVGSTY